MKTHWSKGLQKLSACPGAVKWARTQTTLTRAWQSCERGDWMLWLVGRMTESEPWSEERKPLVRVACACARLAPCQTKASRACIEAVEAWCDGHASQANVLDAAEVATDTAYAAAYTAAADPYAAYAYAAAGVRVLKEYAGIVRQHFPVPPKL